MTVNLLKAAAADFARDAALRDQPSLFGVTDGKAIGTFLEQSFHSYLSGRFSIRAGNSGKGIDLPALDVDIKTTSVRQPQSSCPFKSARQKIYGLGYSLLIFTYKKIDHHSKKSARLTICHVIFVEADATGDYQTTRGINDILDNEGNEDDLVAYLTDRYLPVDETEARSIAADLLRRRPKIGYLTISNALQWRLQYGRVIARAGAVKGVYRLA